MIKNFQIGKFRLNENSKCIIVAEISANHTQSLSKTKKLIDGAVKSGADAIKIQTYTPESLTIISHNVSSKLKKTPWSKFSNRYELFKKASLPFDWHEELFLYAKSKKIMMFSSPFSEKDVNFLEKLKCPAYKLASPEITDIPLITSIAKTRKPVIMSLGLASLKDTSLAIDILKKYKSNNFMLLKCTAVYPALPEMLNLDSINTLKKKFKCQIGFSDHTIGSYAPITASILGAKLIEKHIKLDDEKKSVDSFFSTSVTDFGSMVMDIRNANKSKGSKKYILDKKSIAEMKTRKSLFAKTNLKKGMILQKKNIACVRPFSGLHPKFYFKILGKKIKKDIKIGKSLKLEFFY